MTEMQAVIGKVQLKKFNFIIKENKKRHNVLENNLKKLSTIEKPLKVESQFLILLFLSPKKIGIKLLNIYRKRVWYKKSTRCYKNGIVHIGNML